MENPVIINDNIGIELFFADGRIATRDDYTLLNIRKMAALEAKAVFESNPTLVFTLGVPAPPDTKAGNWKNQVNTALVDHFKDSRAEIHVCCPVCEVEKTRKKFDYPNKATVVVVQQTKIKTYFKDKTVQNIVDEMLEKAKWQIDTRHDTAKALGTEYEGWTDIVGTTDNKRPIPSIRQLIRTDYLRESIWRDPYIWDMICSDCLGHLTRQYFCDAKIKIDEFKAKFEIEETRREKEHQKRMEDSRLAKEAAIAKEKEELAVLKRLNQKLDKFRSLEPYYIISKTIGEVNTLQDTVKAFIEDGYIPLGGPQVIGNDIIQALQPNPQFGIYLENTIDNLTIDTNDLIPRGKFVGQRYCDVAKEFPGVLQQMLDEDISEKERRTIDKALEIYRFNYYDFVEKSKTFDEW